MPRRQGFKPGMLGRRMWSFARTRIERYAASSYPLEQDESFPPLAENVEWEEPYQDQDATAQEEPPVAATRPPRAPDATPPSAPPTPPTVQRQTPRPVTTPPASPPPVQRTATPTSPPPLARSVQPQASTPPAPQNTPTPTVLPRPAAPMQKPGTQEIKRQPLPSRGTPPNQPKEPKIEPHLFRILEAHENKAAEDAAQQAANPAPPAPTPETPRVQRMPRKGLVEEITPKMASFEEETGDAWEQEAMAEEPALFEPEDVAFTEIEHDTPQTAPQAPSMSSDIPAAPHVESIQRSPARSRFTPPTVEDDEMFIPTPIDETEAMPLPVWDDAPYEEETYQEEAPVDYVEDDEPTVHSRDEFTPPPAPSTPPTPSASTVQREPMPDLPPSFFTPPTMSPSGDVSLETLDDESDRETEQVDYNSGAASNLLNPFHRADLRRKEVDGLLETIRRAESPAPQREPEAPRKQRTQQRTQPPTSQHQPEIQREAMPVDEDVDSGDEPPHLFEALMDAGIVRGRRVEPTPEPAQAPRSSNQPPVQRKRAPTIPAESMEEEAYDAVVPDEGSVESDLLDMLDMPTNTPVVGLRPSTPQQPNRAPIARQEYAEDTHWEPHHDTSNAPQQYVQREEVAPNAAPSNPAPNSSDSPNAEGGEEGPNIDKLAREVFRLLRGRLRVEQERRTDK